MRRPASKSGRPSSMRRSPRRATAHGAASDELAQAQTRYREADKAQRLAAEALSGFREHLGRVEERLKGLIAQRHQIERQVQETLDIEATETAFAAGIKPQDALPEEEAIERKVERLKAERERLGGVNLAAETESVEVQEKLDIMVKDRDDLIAAIAKLRSGIQSLNKEGRARLTEAFEKVNAPLPGAVHDAVRRRHGGTAVRRERRSAGSRASRSSPSRRARSRRR